MKVVYVYSHWGEIVIGEAPVGASTFWPAETPISWTDGKVQGHWRINDPVRDALQPRTRIVSLCHEVPEDKLVDVIHDAYARLSGSRQRKGTFGVILKRYGEERKQRNLFPLDSSDALAVGFFHVPETSEDTFIDWLPQEPPRPDLPKSMTPPALMGLIKGAGDPVYYPRVSWEGRPDHVDSIALVISIKGRSRILDWVGPSLSYAFENDPQSPLGGPPGDGLFIWEGSWVRSGDDDNYLDGTFRELTEGELDRFVADGEEPWILTPGSQVLLETYGNAMRGAP